MILSTAAMRDMQLRRVVVDELGEDARVVATPTATPGEPIVIEDRDVETCLERLQARRCPPRAVIGRGAGQYGTGAGR